MKLTLRAGVALLSVAGLAAGAFANPDWSEQIGVDVWNMPELHDHIEREKITARALEARAENATHRVQLRQNLVQNVIDGNITYTDAVQVNLELSLSNAESTGYLRSLFSGSGDLEKSAKQPVAQVEASMDPRGKEVSQQMACELGTTSWE